MNYNNSPIAGYDGVSRITVIDPTHFTYTAYNTGLANNANGGTASRPNVLVLNPGTYYINQTLTFDNRASTFIYGADDRRSLYAKEGRTPTIRGPALVGIQTSSGRMRFISFRFTEFVSGGVGVKWNETHPGIEAFGRSGVGASFAVGQADSLICRRFSR